jgi:serine/threonine protein kinase
MSTSPTNTVGGYLLIDRLAVGGAAELYRARHPQSGEVVVVKRLRPDLPFDPEVSGGFLREIQLAMLSNHRNLIRGSTTGTHQGLEYVVIEYVAGQDMERFFRKAKERGHEVPLAVGLFIVREILDGLAFAHMLTDHAGNPFGLVHRDLNPRNIIIGYDGRVKVGDFGAAIATSQEPAPDEVVGSPGYLSPEQASLSPLDLRSDIFAAGCILFEVVTGLRAFDLDKKKDAAVLRMHQRAELSPIPDHVDERLRFIIEIACAADADERYQSASAMRDAIDGVLKGLIRDSGQGLLASTMQTVFAAEMRELQAKFL